MSEPMPLADKIFYLVSGAFLVVFGTGLWMVFVENNLSTGIPLSGLGLIGMGASLLEKPRETTPETARQRRYIILNAVLAVCIVAVVGYDVYDRHHHESARPRPILTSWGGGAGPVCDAQIDGSALIESRDDYRVVIVCGITDPSIDRLDDMRITVSRAFIIENSPMNISANYSKEMLDGFNVMAEQLAKNTPQPPPGTRTKLVINWSQWTDVVLLPKNVSTSDIHRLSDLTRLGGTIVDGHASGMRTLVPSR